MKVEFPWFGFERDDLSMLLVERPDRLLYHLETIDIETDKYLFLGFDRRGSLCVGCG
jgi:hypothetical protein